jgi:hypothetical protein
METRIAILALAAALLAPLASAAEAPASAGSAARSLLADRDDGGRAERGAARTRPGRAERDDRYGRDDRYDDGSYDADRRRGRAASANRRDGRSGAFPFLDGGHGLVLRNVPRAGWLDSRDLEWMLGRDAYRRLERDVRRAGLGGHLHGAWHVRNGNGQLDISAGNLFLGRLLDRNRDRVIDEVRPSGALHRRLGR